MTNFTKARKFLAVALATVVLGAGMFAATSPASAHDCYDTYVPHYHYGYHYSYGYHHYNHHSYGYSYGY